jgi:hypothetical protein
MQCPSCGNTVDDNDIVCKNCGVSLAGSNLQIKSLLKPPPSVIQRSPQQDQPAAEKGELMFQPKVAPRGNYVISKILTLAGILIGVCFFLPWLANAPVSGLDLFTADFNKITPIIASGLGSNELLLLVMSFVFTFFYIFIPLAGLASLLSLTNARDAVKAVQILAGFGLAGMLGNALVNLIRMVQGSGGVVANWDQEVGNSFFSGHSLGYWVCLVGLLALVIGIGIDLSLNQPDRPKRAYY